MEEKTIRITPFMGEEEKWHIWLVTFMARAGIKGYHVLLTCAKKIPADGVDKTE